MPLPKIGEPIPLGIIKAEDTDTLGVEMPSVSDQIAVLRDELAALRSMLADVGRATSETVRAHPIIAASVISIGLWALIGLTSRRVVSRWH
jgi:hypothetical protein